jgi:hypothetical protein
LLPTASMLPAPLDGTPFETTSPMLIAKFCGAGTA